ncbi:periplasmic nitrate reductase subunit NapB [Mesocricetibacter intestinalis]|uniref:Periplasmic nitrate reductase, electron transfer subunit n=1 Tax=Mesocricetibacter intestinalis TaxID=1521930 RepID=A0A4R6V772_9PAST|nr:nitrate reductase cytochrome c-type subunit [Mesocricetibacter intestinalis]TDQ56662.1 periplasmic nitrate reductase subunit NapB [Mesocricetibacter intestinalis]
MLKKILLMASAICSMWAVAQEQPATIGDSIMNAAENVAPAFHNMPKETGNIAPTFPHQPPLVPHSIRGLQVSKNVNQCLACHGLDFYQTTGAPRVPESHFKDRSGVAHETESPRRYFCLQCHVQQADVNPIIDNKFQTIKATKGFKE